MPKKTVGFWDAIAVAAAACGVGSLLCAPVMGATCNPGYYLNNGECTKCLAGYYCPGDDSQKICVPVGDSTALYSDAGATECKKCPAQAFDETHHSHYWYWSENGIHAGIAGCRKEWGYGDFRFSCAYNTNGYAPIAGKNMCMVWVKSCPGGYYCDGCGYNTTTQEAYYWTDSHTQAASFQCQAVGFGFYSPDNDPITRTQCPDGTSTFTKTSVSVDACQPLCAAGITKIRANNTVAPLWATRHTTPALIVRTAGGVCYGNLTPGSGTGINVTVAGTTYRVE